jgi:hypothetical protein
MKIFMSDGDAIELSCKGLERLAHHCFWYGSCQCGEITCRHWKDKE